jgi:rod shape-determining protein MreD
MKRAIYIFLLVVLAAAAEGGVRPFGVKLNLTALLAFAAGLRGGPLKGMTQGAALGLLVDGMGGGFIGPSLLGKATVGYLAAFVARGFFTWTPFFGFLAALLLTMLDGIVAYGMAALFTGQSISFAAAMTMTALQAVVNAPLGMAVRPRDARQ